MESNGNLLLDELMQDTRIKNLGLKKETVYSILKAHDTIMLRRLLNTGHVELESGMIIDVVQLLDRVHVLRGVPYKSTRKYKLKLTMEDKLYNKIASYYEKLREDIL